MIVSTYNQPDWLRKVLWGYQAQSFRDFELVIADDGSDSRTADYIKALRSELDMPIRHVWHKDRGFRKCEILNRAIIAATGDYFLFTDGDCIPRADLLMTHVRLAKPRRFLSGGYLKLPMDTSLRIGRAEIRAGLAADFTWLRRQGVPVSRRMLRLAMPTAVAAVLDAVTTTRATFNGHNTSVWREDVIAVNGFDERMGWGGLDVELGERLENAGIRALQVRHRAVVVHLDHARGYMQPEVVRRNREIRRETVRLRRTWTAYGLNRHLATAGSGPESPDD